MKMGDEHLFTTITMDNERLPNISDVISGREFPLPARVLMGIIMLLMILISFFGNSIVCLIVYQRTAMRSSINLLLANMALSDMMTSVFPMLYSFADLYWREYVSGEIQCKIMYFIREFLICVGMSMLLSISIDRFLIIVKRKDKLTTTHAKFIVAASWVTSFVLALPPAVGWSHYTIVKQKGESQCTFEFEGAGAVFMVIKLSVSFFIPVLIMTVSFCCILHVVKRNNSRIHNHPNIEFAVSVVSNNGKIGLPVLQRSFQMNFDMTFKTRAFKTILILFLAYFICWMPYTLNIIVTYVSDTQSRTRNVLFSWLGFANCAINPIIYSLRIKKFREACRDLVPNFILKSAALSNMAKRKINPSSLYTYQESSNI